MINEILENLGLTKGEIKVFLALLKLGTTTTGPITKESKVSKSKVYEILERLIEKGLVSQIIENNVKKFQSINPNQLIKLYEEKENELRNLKKNLIKILPKLEKEYENRKEKQNVTLFQGFTGIKSIFEDILNILDENDEYIVFVAVKSPKYFQGYLRDWSKRSIKKKIKMKIIVEKNTKVFREDYDDKFSEIKTIMKEFNTPAVFNLYKNKTAIILWSENPIGILIEDTQINESFKKYFDFLWSLAK